MRITRLPAVLGCFVMAACATTSRLKVGETPGGEVIEVTGEAMIEPSNMDGSKRRSLAEAQKKAVEEVVGVHVSAKTLVDKAITIQQNILAKTEGYIQKYDVLKTWEDAPYYKTTIRALVLYQKLSDDLKAAGLLSRPSQP